MNVTFDELERTYQMAVASGNEPNLLPIRIATKTKAVRRVIGRWVRRGMVRQGDYVPVDMHGRFGIYRV